MIGTVLKHRYEVIEKIGDGSLFTVYRCDDKIDNRPVAVKVLLPQYASNRMFAERVLVEAQAMVGLQHPGIVEVYDCGEENGCYYTVVEYVRGVDLQERIRRNAPFALTTVVDVGLALCDVLDFAHRKGFMHGDLRPGNILVSPEGQIKIADFWVSNAVAAAPTLRTNAMMRSVHYMAPEIADSKPVSPASDVYSVGVMLFELLTATVPYDGDTPMAIAVKHARDPIPSARALNPGTPKNLEAAIAKALQKSPQDRFRSARSMHHELKSIRDSLHFEKPITWSEPKEPVVPRHAPKAAPEAEAEAPRPAASRAATESIPPTNVAIPREPVFYDEDEMPAFWVTARKTLLIVIGLVFAAILAMMAWAMTTPGDVKVPNFVGKQLAVAENMAANSHIDLVVRTEQFNEDHPAGAVYYMHPLPGRSIKSGKSVDVWVSKGSRFATVPNVAKIPLETAKTRIVDAGLNVGEVTQDYSDKIPPGDIIKQTPTSGTRQERGTAVNLVFSLGPEADDSALTQEEYDTGAKTRTFTVVLKEIPPGPEDQKVEVVVQDDYGETTVFTDIMHPGDALEQRVQGVGNKVTIRIYIDDKLVKEERKWK